MGLSVNSDPSHITVYYSCVLNSHDLTWQSKMAMGFSFTVGDVPVEITRNSSGISPDAGGKTSG